MAQAVFVLANFQLQHLAMKFEGYPRAIMIMVIWLDMMYGLWWYSWMLCMIVVSLGIPSGKLENPRNECRLYKKNHPFLWSIFHCHLWLPEGHGLLISIAPLPRDQPISQWWYFKIFKAMSNCQRVPKETFEIGDVMFSVPMDLLGFPSLWGDEFPKMNLSSIGKWCYNLSGLVSNSSPYCTNWQIFHM